MGSSGGLAYPKAAALGRPLLADFVRSMMHLEPDVRGRCMLRSPQLDGRPSWVLPDLEPWPGDPDALDRATVALIRASRRNAVFVYSARGIETPVDVGQVQPFPPKHLRTIVVDGFVDGHQWSSSEARLLGMELGEAHKSTLAGAKRSFAVKVTNTTSMQSVLRISASRERRLWTLDQYEYVVDGGRKKIENRLVDFGE